MATDRGIRSMTTTITPMTTITATTIIPATAMRTPLRTAERSSRSAMLCDIRNNGGAFHARN